MPVKRYTTKSIHQAQVPPQWVEIDAAGKIVGRLASEVARLLRGKDKPFYTPHVDCGTHVVIINAAQVIFTGQKEKNKTYIRHTGYPGGQRQTTPDELRARRPTSILEKAILGMMRKNKLDKAIYRKKLYIYPGPTHPHTAQTKHKP